MASWASVTASSASALCRPATGGLAALAACSSFSAVVSSSSAAAMVGTGVGGQVPSQRTSWDSASSTLSMRRGLSLTDRLRNCSVAPPGPMSLDRQIEEVGFRQAHPRRHIL